MCSCKEFRRILYFMSTRFSIWQKTRKFAIQIRQRFHRRAFLQPLITAFEKILTYCKNFERNLLLKGDSCWFATFHGSNLTLDFMSFFCGFFCRIVFTVFSTMKNIGKQPDWGKFGLDGERQPLNPGEYEYSVEISGFFCRSAFA